MKRGTFMDIVGIHYDDIKNTYFIRDKASNRKFNDDAFNDAFIKCAKHFNNDIIEYDDVIKYFWIAYVNTCKNNFKQTSIIDFCEEYSEDISDEDDTESFTTNFYNTCMDAITEAFNENDMLIYSLYKYHKWTKDDLIAAGYDCNNFEIRIKTIHRFLKEYCKKKYKTNK